MANHKFKAGDHLVMTRDDWFKKGTRVTVVGVDDGDIMPYLCSDGERNLWIAKDSVAPGSEADEKPEFHVGQIYRVSDAIEENGNIIKIVDADGDDCKYQTLRGVNNGTNSFRVRSQFATTCLTLLTGSQIGEAIRKWDDEHSAKESGVKEVKRRANVGEYIKIINAQPPHFGYSNGDIILVDHLDSTKDDQPCGKNTNWICDREYVVLEGYSPVKEVKRHAKTGEYIKIINAEFPGAGETYKDGDIVKVLGDGNETAFGKSANIDRVDAPYVLDREYVVLEGYRSEQNGKHSYTAAEIEEAKKLVLGTVSELAEKSTYILFDGVGHGNDNYTAYIVGKGSATEFDEGDLTISGVKTGESKCSPNDEPNEWVGKAVALCKALHKPLPSFVR